MRLNILAAAVAVALAGSSASAQESIVQGASSSGHTTFQIMTGWSSVINREVPEVSMTVQASGPSVPTTQLVQQGRIQAGPAGNSAPYEAVRSIANFEGQPKADKVRTWMPIYVYGAQLVVPAESDVQDWTDLEGLRVGVGSVGSVGEQTNKAILETLGVGYDKIDEYQIGHGEMVAGLKNGTLDAIIETTGIPTAGVLELEATRDIRIVGLTEEQAAEQEEIEVYCTSFRPMQTAFVDAPDRVLMKLIVSKANRTVLGCHIVAPGAGEMIQLAGIAVKMGATKEDFDRTVAVHPTMSEEIVTMRNPARTR